MRRHDNTGVDPTGRDVVELRVPARADMFATVRAVAADVAYRADFDVDTVADVRMAVDEACNQIVEHADSDHPMCVAFRLENSLLRVTITARTTTRGGLDTSGFGWQVMSALTDKLETEHGTGVGGDEVVIRLAKKGPEV